MRSKKARVVSSAAIAAIFLAEIGFQQQAAAQDTPPDRTSKVPQYTFADTLEKQEVELKVIGKGVPRSWR